MPRPPPPPSPPPPSIYQHPTLFRHNTPVYSSNNDRRKKMVWLKRQTYCKHRHAPQAHPIPLTQSWAERTHLNCLLESVESSMSYKEEAIGADIKLTSAMYGGLHLNQTNKLNFELSEKKKKPIKILLLHENHLYTRKSIALYFSCTFY